MNLFCVINHKLKLKFLKLDSIVLSFFIDIPLKSVEFEKSETLKFFSPKNRIFTIFIEKQTITIFQN